MEREIEQIREQAKAEGNKAVEPLKTALDARTGQVKQLLVDANLTEAIVKAKGKPHMLKPALERLVRVDVDDSGALVAQVVDADGTPREKGKDLEPMGIEDLVAEFAANPDWAGAFDGTGNSGGGTNGNPGPGPGRVTPEAVKNMSMAEFRKAREEGRI